MITKEQFKKYEKVRKSGVINMFDVKRVEELTGISKQEILEIMKNYETLQEELE